MNYLVYIYIAGFVISAIKSFYAFSGLSLLTQKTNPDFFKKRPDVIVYMILKPILWPYFFIIEKTPLERISELFFSRYGEEGIQYFGDRGVKNFLNDIFRGKRRYRNYITKKVFWTVEKNSETYHEYVKFHENFAKDLNAKISYAKYSNKYLLAITLTSDSYDYNQEISRFDLDQCQPLDENKFRDRLLEINKENTEILLNELNAGTLVIS